jgi:uncharacterized protein YnzC (UPF0291/DUF896 family)
MSPESAVAILALHYDRHAVRRMNELADKNRGGVLTESERQEMEKYPRVGKFLKVIQAKARLALPAGS